MPVASYATTLAVGKFQKQNRDFAALIDAWLDSPATPPGTGPLPG